MLKLVSLLLFTLFLPVVAEDVVELYGAGSKPMEIRVLLSSDEKVVFIRMSDGRRFVHKLEQLSQSDQTVIATWKSEQVCPERLRKKEGKLNFDSEERFEKAWESIRKRSRMAVRAAQSRTSIIKTEKLCGERLSLVTQKLITDLDIILHHEEVMISVSERRRLKQITEYLQEVTQMEINEILLLLDTFTGTKRNLRADPVKWPELPIFASRGKVLNQVPHVHQLKSYCGPATAEMLLSSRGISVSQRVLAGRFSERSAQHHGTFPSDMVREIRKLDVPVSLMYSKEILGLDNGIPQKMSENKIATQIKKNCFNFLKKQIDAGNPVITTVKHGNNGIGHFVCVIGYDYVGNEPVILFRDPLDKQGSRPKQFTLQDFVKYWIYEDDDGVSLEAIALE